MASFLDHLHDTVAKQGNRTFASWYDENGSLSSSYSFDKLWEDAGLIAYYLRKKWGVSKGDRVVLCYNFGLQFFASFLGCLRAGIVAVLVYPPALPLSKSLPKMTRTIDDCSPVLILTDSTVLMYKRIDTFNPTSKTRKMWPVNIDFKTTDDLTARKPILRIGTKRQKNVFFDEEDIRAEDLAFLQYTSGSTGNPKGVMVTFSALHANIQLILNGFYKCYREDGGIPAEGITGFSWLPQYHDLGLIYAAIAPFAGGWYMHMMSPVTFIKKPLLWLELMSRHRVSWGVAPDFAYNLVVRRFKEARERCGGGNPMAGLDLSCIHNLQNGTEPVRLHTKTDFEDIFMEYGLRKNWFHAGYGLAENVVGVCWMHGYRISSPRPEDISPLVAVGSRRTFDASLAMKIVDPATSEEVMDGVTGELWIAGPSVTAGYYEKTDLTESMFSAKLIGSNMTFLQTGDLAFFQDDYLFICGRIKDLIIVNGTNYYPQDIEAAAQDASPYVRPGCVAAFSSNETGNDGDVEIVFELRRSAENEADKVIQAVRNNVLQTIGLTPSRIVAIKEKTIPKTTSGKIQRRASRRALNDGTLFIILEHSDRDKCQTSEQVKDLMEYHPQVAVDAVCAIEVDAEKLDSCFKQHRCTLKTAGMLPLDKKSFDDIEADDPGILMRYDVILHKFFEDNYDMDKTWEQLGMSSMISVEFRSLISETLQVTLPPDFQTEYPTPRALGQFIERSARAAIPVELPQLTTENRLELHPFVTDAIQSALILVNLLLAAFSFVPVYHFGKGLASVPGLNQSVGRVHWQWIPLIIPCWMICFSFLVIATKWIIIGRYTAKDASVKSMWYLRWWFVDRLVNMWEWWIGQLIMNTPLIWFFYFAMGARVHPSVQIKASIREFDLVEIDAQAQIQSAIKCRQFSSWDDEQARGLRLRLRPVRVGCLSKISGHLGPGVTVGKYSVVERLTAVEEGAQVPDNVIVEGIPASIAGSASSESRALHSTARLYTMGMLKLVWLIAELYLFFAFLLIGQWMPNGNLPHTWRYTPLLYWCLQLLLSTVLSMTFCVPLKWTLIGRKKPGVASSSLLSDFVDWGVDYHFDSSIRIISSVLENSMIMIVYLKALGMHVDMVSHVWAIHCPPSKVDLITVRRSFLSTVVFETNRQGHVQEVEIVDSHVGHTVVIDGGVKLTNTSIPPRSRVHASIGVKGGNLSQSRAYTSWYTDLVAVITLVFLFFTLIPAYELFQCQSLGEGIGLGFSVVKLALAFLAQTLTWSVFFVMWSRMIMVPDRQGNWHPLTKSLYHVYMPLSFFLMWRWSFLPLIFGTVWINLYLICLGSKIDGRLLYFGSSSYEFPLLTFRDKTVVDCATVCAHSFVTGGLLVSPSVCAGTIHPDALVLANTDMTGSLETRPLRFVTPSF